MGLDCWLYIKKFIFSDEQAEKDELRELIKEKLRKGKNEIFDDIDDMKDYELKELKWEVGYWRKANQIHKWFVDNVQKGEDDCRDYWVDKEQLQSLLEIVNKILNEKDKKKQVELAHELLPTKEGFFFGGTDYDNYYFDDLKNTKEIIEKLFKIKNLDNYDIEYTSSW